MEREFKDDTAIQYLLGQLSEQEREQFEERYFTDESFFENFLAVKDELIDLYARDELPNDQREPFEEHFLSSPTLRQRIDNTKRIIAAVSQPFADGKVKLPSQIVRDSGGWWTTLTSSLRLDSRILQFSVGVLALIALVLAGWWWQSRSRNAQIEAQRQLQNEKPLVQPTAPSSAQVDSSPHPAQAQSPDGQKKTLPSPTTTVEQATKVPTLPDSPAPPKSQVQAASVATITLTPVVLRDSDNSPRLLIEPSARLARLILVLKKTEFKNYVAVVRTLEGDEVKRLRGLEARKSRSGSHVTIDLPTELLTRQGYLVTLSGVTRSGSVEEIGKYHLMLDRKEPEATQPSFQPQPRP